MVGGIPMLDSLASLRLRLRFGELSIRFRSEHFGESSIFGFNRKSTSSAWCRVFLDSRPIQPQKRVSQGALGVPEFVLTRNILGFSGHVKNIGAQPLIDLFRSCGII